MAPPAFVSCPCLSFVSCGCSCVAFLLWSLECLQSSYFIVVRDSSTCSWRGVPVLFTLDSRVNRPTSLKVDVLRVCVRASVPSCILLAGLCLRSQFNCPFEYTKKLKNYHHWIHKETRIIIIVVIIIITTVDILVLIHCDSLQCFTLKLKPNFTIFAIKSSWFGPHFHPLPPRGQITNPSLPLIAAPTWQESEPGD